jgi:cadmium resistance protein CadD (predicted permease)
LAFAATNVDDVVVLTVLSARRDGEFRAAHIVAGQYLGFAVLVAVSLAAAAGLLALPAEAVGVLGLVPIGLGLRGLWRAWRLESGRVSLDDSVAPLSMSVGSVAWITVANGADNIAIYAPLFATSGTGGIATTLATFFVLVAVWCAAGLLLGDRPAVRRAVNWAGLYAIPVVLIGLGIYIVADSGLLS